MKVAQVVIDNESRLWSYGQRNDHQGRNSYSHRLLRRRDGNNSKCSDRRRRHGNRGSNHRSLQRERFRSSHYSTNDGIDDDVWTQRRGLKIVSSFLLNVGPYWTQIIIEREIPIKTKTYGTVSIKIGERNCVGLNQCFPVDLHHSRPRHHCRNCVKLEIWIITKRRVWSITLLTSTNTGRIICTLTWRRIFMPKAAESRPEWPKRSALRRI